MRTPKSPIETEQAFETEQAPKAEKGRKKPREIPPNALGYRPLEFAALIGVGKTKAFEMIRRGEVESVLIGRTRIVKAASARALIERAA